MKCTIIEVGKRDGWYPDKQLFVGVKGEFVEDDVFEYDEESGWAMGNFYADPKEKVNEYVHFPTFFAEVKVERK